MLLTHSFYMGEFKFYLKEPEKKGKPPIYLLLTSGNTYEDVMLVEGTEAEWDIFYIYNPSFEMEESDKDLAI